MKINFIGGANKVTGTCYSLTLGEKLVMIDCGMEQGEAGNIDYDECFSNCAVHDELIVTHCHIDHIAMIPLVVKKGKIRSITSTAATRELAALLLTDNVKIQQENNKIFYNENDVMNCMYIWEVIDHNVRVNKESYSYSLFKNSHIVGSASIFMETDTGNILFSSDLGTANQLLMDYPPQIPSENVDYLVIETTYGDKDHPSRDEESSKLLTLAEDALIKGGKVIIPSFAIGRTQELLYALSNSRLSDNYPIYIDTPLGQKVTALMDKYVFYLKKKFSKGIEDKTLFGKYQSVNTMAQSKALATSETPYIVISASGMLEGGRVLNHFEQIKNDPKSLLMFCGYQGRGTRGQKIIDGEIKVNCQIGKVSGFSAHACQSELLEYIDRQSYLPYKTYLIHGDDSQRTTFSNLLKAKKIRHELPNNSEISHGLKLEKQSKFIMSLNIKFTKIGDIDAAPIIATAIKEKDTIRIAEGALFGQLLKDAQDKHLLQNLELNDSSKPDFDKWKSEFTEIIWKNKLLGRSRIEEFMEDLSSGIDQYKTKVLTIIRRGKFNVQSKVFTEQDNQLNPTLIEKANNILSKSFKYGAEDLFSFYKTIYFTAN